MNDMNFKNVGFLVSLMLIGLLAGCVEETAIEIVDPVEGEPQSAESALVTPEFRISGLEDVPEELVLERIGLSVSEIRLEPLDSGGSGIAYATSRPFGLTFDLSEGEEVLHGGTVEFPETGRFLVSIRLEPSEATEFDFEMFGSLGIQGKVRDDHLVSDGEKEDGDENDGSPLPLPFDRINEDIEASGTWTPFQFTSQRAVFYTFTDVNLVPGEQHLTFDFDMNDWATGAVDPIIDAVDRMEPGGIVDVSNEVDAWTSNPESLLDSGSVSTGTGTF